MADGQNAPQANPSTDTEGLTFGSQPQQAGAPADDSSELTFGPTPQTSNSAAPAAAAQPEAAQPGFVERAANVAVPAVKLLSQEAASRLFTARKAIDAVKNGNLSQAASLAYAAVTGMQKDDPLYETMGSILQMPVEEAKQAYASFKAKDNLLAASHAINAVPLIGPIASGIGTPIGEDIAAHNWRGAAGSVVGNLALLGFGAESKAAEDATAAAAEGGDAEAKAAAEAAERESKSSALRVSKRQIGRDEIEHAVADASNPEAVEQAKNLQRIRTQPQAVGAAHNTLEDVARGQIEKLRVATGDTRPFEEDMSTIAKQSGAMKNAAQEVYKKFDEASDAEAEEHTDKMSLAEKEHDAEQAEAEKAFNEKQAQTKHGEFSSEKGPAKKFVPKEFEPEEAPETFRDLQTKRAAALDTMRKGSPAGYQAAKDDLAAIEQRMDDFADRHQDIVSPEEYKAANGLRSAADKHDFINKGLVIDKGTDEIPASISKASMKSLPRKFDLRYGDGAWDKYMGPEGVENYNQIRNILEDPVEGPKFVQSTKKWWHRAAGRIGQMVGTGIGAAVGGAPGAIIGSEVSRDLLENLALNPSVGEMARRLYREESGSMTIPGTGGAAAAPAEAAPSAVDSIVKTEEPNSLLQDARNQQQSVEQLEANNRARAAEMAQKYPVRLVTQPAEPFAPPVSSKPDLRKVMDATRQQLAGQGGHAGGGVASVEELSRPGVNYMVDKSGKLTYHGKSFAPEETPKGGAHVTVLPDGKLRVNEGILTPAMERSLRQALKK